MAGVRQELIKPILKWAGGKRQLLPLLKQYIPTAFDVYFEPFVGAGAVLFELQPKEAVINDLNEQLMLTYKVIRDDVETLIALLKEHEANNSLDYFYEIRALDRNEKRFEKLSDAEKAARLIYLNKTCFNGLYRVNSKGEFNVPYGNYVRPLICEKDALRIVGKYLQQNDIDILAGDFADAVARAKAGDFVYFDPPYYSGDNTNFTSYQAEDFGAQAQERLRDVFKELAERGVKCLLSNSDTDFIRHLYSDFPTVTVEAARTISSDIQGRGKVTEVLIRSW
ncbi:MAG: DNA adenine methylase [Firmicutes bacterium]|nr:DNA adenine methylase [Bacillota bacterium]